MVSHRRHTTTHTSEHVGISLHPPWVPQPQSMSPPKQHAGMEPDDVRWRQEVSVRQRPKASISAQGSTQGRPGTWAGTPCPQQAKHA